MMGGYVRKGHILLFVYALNHHIVPFHVAIKIKRSLECNVWSLFYGKNLLEVCLHFLLNKKWFKSKNVADQPCLIGFFCAEGACEKYLCKRFCNILIIVCCFCFAHVGSIQHKHSDDLYLLFLRKWSKTSIFIAIAANGNRWRRGLFFIKTKRYERKYC